MRILLILIALIATCTIANAQETMPFELELPDISDIDELSFDPALDSSVDLDFDPTLNPQIPSPAAITTPKWWDTLRYTFAYNLAIDTQQRSDIKSNRLTARVQWEQLLAEYYYLLADGKVFLRGAQDQQLDPDNNPDIELRLRELSIQASTGQYSLKAGYQLAIWGEFDSAIITDVMSPWDYSQFAFTAPEDARVGQPMLSAQYYSDYGKWQLIATPTPFINRYPNGNADELLLYALNTETFNVDDNSPQPFDDYELGARWQHTFESSDISIMGASVMSDDPLFISRGPNDQGILDFDTQYKRYYMTGFTVNYNTGQYLWKTEMAFKINRYFPGQAPITRNTFEAAIGIEHNANGAYTLGIDFINQHILSGNGKLTGLKTNNSQLMGRWSKNYLHETFSAIYFISYQLQYGDRTHSAALRYAINDFWTAELNLTIFDIRNNKSPNQFIDNWDQLSLRLSVAI